MFTDQKNFNSWLKKQKSDQFSKLSDYLDKKQREQLYLIYQDCLNLENYTLGHVIERLSAAIADLVQLAAEAGKINPGSKKKAFVMESVDNLYRLIDQGMDGTEDNIDKEAIALAGYYGISTEDDFREMILKMADQGIESLFDH